MKRLASFLLLLALGGCTTATLHPADDTTPDLVVSQELRSLPASVVFEEAADEFDVPRELLATLAWKQTSFAPGEHDHDEHAPMVGWYGLRPEQVELAAELTGFDPEAIADAREEGIYAGAAVLDALRSRYAPTATGTLDARWWPVVVAFPELGEEWLDHQFALDVFDTLQRGFAYPTASGDVVEVLPVELPGLMDVDVVQPPTGDDSAFAAGTDYPGAARFTPAHSSNQSNRSNGAASIRRVVIHTTEGSYGGAISWFRNSSANVSAHYVIRKSDGEVTQMVRDHKKAWHACNNNNDTIGIEHEGASSNASTWTNAMLESSARLTAFLVTEYNIPIDRDHIVGHGEIQGAGCSYRYDPGPHFPWTQYLQMVSGYANPSSGGGGGGGGSTTPAPPAGPTPTVAFQNPRDGDTIGNPVQMRVTHSNVHHVDVYAGGTRIAYDLTASPVHVGRPFSVTGQRTLKVKGYSASGAVVATDTVTVNVTNTQGTVTPSAAQVNGMTYRMTSTTTGPGVATVKYWVDGWPLKDIDSNSYESTGATHELDYTFGYAAYGRQLVARSYSSSGALIGEGFAYVDVNPTSTPSTEAITNVNVQEAGGTMMYFRSTATPGVAKVEYWIEGWRLPDAYTGQTYATPSDFGLWYAFNYTGERQLEVKAFDASGTLVDTRNQTILVPAADLSVSWTRLGTKSYRFDAAAPAATDRVIIEIDGWALPDKVTGDSWCEGPDYILNYDFNYGGYRALHAEAVDQFGNVLDTFDANISVY